MLRANAESFSLFDLPTSPATEMSFKLPDRNISFATVISLNYENMDITNDCNVVSYIVEE